jgi:hypothetical protein
MGKLSSLMIVIACVSFASIILVSVIAYRRKGKNRAIRTEVLNEQLATAEALEQRADDQRTRSKETTSASRLALQHAAYKVARMHQT